MQPLCDEVKNVIACADVPALDESEMHEAAAEYLTNYLRLWLEKHGDFTDETIRVPRGLVQWFLAYDNLQKSKRN